MPMTNDFEAFVQGQGGSRGVLKALAPVFRTSSGHMPLEGVAIIRNSGWRHVRLLDDIVVLELTLVRQKSAGRNPGRRPHEKGGSVPLTGSGFLLSRCRYRINKKTGEVRLCSKQFKDRSAAVRKAIWHDLVHGIPEYLKSGALRSS